MHRITAIILLTRARTPARLPAARWRSGRGDRRSAAGAAAGIVGGLTGAMAPRFHHYVVEEHVPSYQWREHPHVVVGKVLPAEGVSLYPVPPE